MREVEKTTDHVDILFANAGATWGAAFDKHPDGAFGKVMDLNVKSVFNTIRLYASLLKMCNGLIFFRSYDFLPDCCAGLRFDLDSRLSSRNAPR